MSSEFFKRVLSSIILIPLIFFFIIQESIIIFFFTIICFLISCYEWHMMTKNKFYKYYGFLFLLISFYAFYEVSNDLFDVIFVIIICISTDMGGYFFGKIFKGPKLTKISPNKTYAGMIGGYFLSLLSLTIIYTLLDYKESLIKLLILAILISTISQIGDISISYFKRLSKIKNTGKLIPGHGGLLDRIDGMLFSFPLYYLFSLTG